MYSANITHVEFQLTIIAIILIQFDVDKNMYFEFRLQFKPTPTAVMITPMNETIFF